MSFFLVQLLSGIAGASSLFLVASGLSVIFGVTRIVNFAHGSFYMIGAYTAYSVSSALPSGLPSFALALIGAALTAGILGAAVEAMLLRRLHGAPEMLQLLATFGILLVLQDATLKIWGPEELLASRPALLRGAVSVLGRNVPVYDLVLIAAGLIMLLLLTLLFQRTRWGWLLRAATQDRAMVGALGIDERRLFTGVFALGCALAGLGGALQLPREPANLGMDLGIIVEAFVVVVIGGMGSIAGAYLAALLIGIVHAFGIVLFPQLTLVLIFLVMAVVLTFRPNGLLGRPIAEPPVSGSAGTGINLPDMRLVCAVLALLAAMPLIAGPYLLSLLGEIAILALFAASLHFLIGPAGLASFGHAAYFGIGAYTAALTAATAGLGMVAGLMAAPVAAGLAGLAFATLAVRLSGIYLAMLTLAYAQIIWSGAVQWSGLTGGDNGLLGIRPAGWASDPRLFYLLALMLSAAGILLLWRVTRSPLGYGLRASRDSARRAAASGVGIGALRRAAFALSAAAAGLAGGLFAFAKGGVFPTYAAIGRSVDGLVMVLLGGLQTLAGPALGAALYTGLQEGIARATDLWRLCLGCLILLLVSIRPESLSGVRHRPARPR